MNKPKINCLGGTVPYITKTDQIALLRSIEMMIGLLPKDTQALLLWEAYSVIQQNITNSAVPQWGVRSALYSTRRAVEDAPSYLTPETTPA